MHVVKQHPRNAAGQVHKVAVVFQLVAEGGVRQWAALADLVAGQQLFDVVLQIGGFSAVISMPLPLSTGASSVVSSTCRIA